MTPIQLHSAVRLAWNSRLALVKIWLAAVVGAKARWMMAQAVSTHKRSKRGASSPRRSIYTQHDRAGPTEGSSRLGTSHVPGGLSSNTQQYGEVGNASQLAAEIEEDLLVPLHNSTGINNSTLRNTSKSLLNNNSTMNSRSNSTTLLNVPLQCPGCGKQCKTAAGLTKHKASCSAEDGSFLKESLRCGDCGLVVKSAFGLTQHKQKFCRGSSENTINNSVASNESVQSLICCGKSWTNKVALRAHQRGRNCPANPKLNISVPVAAAPQRDSPQPPLPATQAGPSSTVKGMIDI